jgi:hypothetical protein
MGQNSVVGIATGHGLYGQDTESQWSGGVVKRYFAPDHPASYTTGTGSFPGVQWPGRGINHPPPSSAEVKERAELHFCSPSVP